MNRPLFALLGTSLPALLAAAPAAPWRDTPVVRLEALALIQTLSNEILAGTSATLALEQWCRTHALAAPAQLVAHRIAASAAAAGPLIRQHLEVTAAEPVRHRRVELRCGEHVLAIADNWYVPARLTPAMNESLEATKAPFGRVVEPLAPRRLTLAATLLWSPLPEGWESAPEVAGPAPAASAQPLALPPALFAHQAVLYTGQHRPIAEVHEVYQRDILAFAEPKFFNH